MTKEELIVLLNAPDKTGQAVDELSRLIDGNPYFHTGHQLYLKGLQQTDEIKMALQLRKTALSVRDRGVLYNYINRPVTFRQQPLPDEHPKEIAAPYVPGDSYVSPENDKYHFRSTHQAPALLGQNLLSMGNEWQKKEEHIFTENFNMSDHQLTEIIRRQLEQISPTDEEELRRETKKEVPTNNDIIDVFLKSNPKIIPDDSRDYHVDLTESLQENHNITTDTLAEIYAAQGHIDKAIEIYEHLILKYPEKHIYFAAQIDRLKVNK